MENTENIKYATSNALLLDNAGVRNKWLKIANQHQKGGQQRSTVQNAGENIFFRYHKLRKCTIVNLQIQQKRRTQFCIKQIILRKSTLVFILVAIDTNSH